MTRLNHEARIHLLARAARMPVGAAVSAPSARSTSILSLAAASYGSRPTADATVPTGFDPIAVALFEAIVEGAYLVANADGVFDARERHAFERVVVGACGGAVPPGHIGALLGELAARLAKDGLDARLRFVARTATKKEHAREVLRVAALLAHANSDVSSVERNVLAKLAAYSGFSGADVDEAIAEGHRALAGPS
ncbi:MAG: tellurite resistance TerB family protein [Polyangiaceae bacterium]|nr:tellurite resistance TerB family protein [Polyangiaceae bacterium]